jgi:hypothetical protein
MEHANKYIKNTYLHTYIHIHTYTHTYIRTYIHTYKHTYINTYIHTHTHTEEYKPLLIRRVQILYTELAIMYRESMRHIRSQLTAELQILRTAHVAITV